MAKNLPTFEFEQALMDRGLTLVAGVDEVGRGPLAGPVVAAAVVLDPANIPPGLNDSKALSAKRRDEIAKQISSSSSVSIGEATVQEIDEINILNATYLAMERAVAGLSIRPEHLLVDGNRLPRAFEGQASAIVKGDSKSLSIAAASIVAKSYRDRIMVDLAQQHPGYGWEKNAGYPTSEHKKALEDIGVTPHHRRSFKPVHNILYQEKLVSR